MIDFNALLGVSTMGGDALRVEGDRTTGQTTVTPLPTVATERAHAGTPEAPTTVSAMTAEVATDQHLLLNSKIAEIDAKLGAQNFDANTGRPTGFKSAEGSRERELLQNERQSLENSLQYHMRRALEQLPKRAERNGAADDALVAQAQREQNISALASTLDSTNGKEIGRVRAAALIDEATLKERAAALVRGSR